MKTKPWVRALCALAVLGLIAAACGDDDTDDGAAGTSAAPAEEPAAPAEPEDPEPEPTAAPAEPEAPEPEPEPEPEAPAEEPMDDPLDLASVCPNPIIIQTDWFPESEHGAMYQLLGDPWTLDVENMRTRGPLVAQGVDTGVDIEIRAGGPAIGFASGASHMYVDQDITLGYVSLDQSIITGHQIPTISVVAPLEKNPQIIQWDPETYPDVESIADLGELGVTINVFAGGTFIDVFVNEGVLSADQIDPSYDGGPARFITEGGAIAQQGFASESPYSYEEVYPEWSKPIAFELIHDAGLPIYSQTLSVRTGDLDSLRPCLTKFVPIVQQAVIDFANDPGSTNENIVQIVADIGSFWQYSPGLAQFSVDIQKELGLIGNGPDDIVGNMDESRVQEVIDKIVSTGIDVDPSRQVTSNLYTNEFIDESIGF